MRKEREKRLICGLSKTSFMKQGSGKLIGLPRIVNARVAMFQEVHLFKEFQNYLLGSRYSILVLAKTVLVLALLSSFFSVLQNRIFC